MLFGCQSLDKSSKISKSLEKENGFEYEINLNDSYKYLNLKLYSFHQKGKWEIVFNRNFQLDSDKINIDINNLTDDYFQIDVHSGNFSQNEDLHIKNIYDEELGNVIYLLAKEQEIDVVNSFGLWAYYYDYGNDNQKDLSFNDLSDSQNIVLGDNDAYFILTAQLIY